MTYQDFGYKTTNVYNLEWENKPEREMLKRLRKLQSEKVGKWWKEKGEKWNRLESIKEALISNDVSRISNVVQFLRFGKTKCNGLNREVFLKEIKPLALNLKDSKNDDIRKIGALLENENLDYWLGKQNGRY